MTLQTSGPISLRDIQAEFGGPTPIRLENYYRGGAYVLTTDYAPNVPASGVISLDNFYGAKRTSLTTVTYNTDGNNYLVLPYTFSGQLTVVSMTGGGGGGGGSDSASGHVGYPGLTITGGTITANPGDIVNAYVGAGGGPGGAGGGGGGGGGGVCFTADSLILLADGTSKPICEIKIGNWVFNYNQTRINQVMHIEQAVDTSFGFLYSPDQQNPPFATANHPLFINGRLSSLDPEKTINLYPWLGPTEQINTTNLAPASGAEVYNLWTNGDHTYVVNGYGTTSIIDDGGLLRLGVEQQLVTAQRASDLIIRFVTLGQSTVYGLYLVNYVLGKLDIRPITKLAAWVFRDDSHPAAQQVFYAVSKLIGTAALLVNKIRRTRS
jgi:hypothetical protein